MHIKGERKMDIYGQKYCISCGRENKIINIGYYDKDTGKPVKKYKECEIKDCQHGYHKRDFPKIWRCAICGEPIKIIDSGLGYSNIQ